MSTDAEFFMKKLDLESSEIIRRFLVASAFKSARVVIISPIKNLWFKRVAYYPYTHGRTPWEAICDLSKFADVAIATEEATDQDGLRLICKLAECSMRRYDHSLRLYLYPSLPMTILVSDTEAIKCDNVCVLMTAAEEGYAATKAEAEDIIKRSKLVDYGMYLDLCEH
jgi:hypothetical protein